jgi:hypothetical protein
MHIMYERCAGLDVHKETVVACVLSPEGPENRTFGTMTAELLTLADWLFVSGCTHVAMESTGDDWKPVFDILEGMFELSLGQCPACQGRPWAQGRRQRCRLAGRTPAAWPVAGQRSAAGGSAGAAGLDPLSPHLHSGAGDPD